MPRTRHNLDMQQAIKDTAWRQIAQGGAAALSLRNIARELRITAPAIYNYYPRRDDLVTALIIDAYTSFGDSQLAARDALPAHDLVGRLTATGLAYRQWAIDHPQRYQLIFGTPIPGYEAPIEKTLPAASRSLSALVSVIEDLRQAGRLRIDTFPEVRGDFKLSFEQWQSHGGQTSLLSLSIAILVWARVHGLVSLEIGGQIPPFGPDGDALYRYELESLNQQLIKELP